MTRRKTQLRDQNKTSGLNFQTLADCVNDRDVTARRDRRRPREWLMLDNFDRSGSRALVTLSERGFGQQHSGLCRRRLP